MPTTLIISFLVVSLVIVLIPILIAISFLPLWIQVQASGISLYFTQLIGMKLRGLRPAFICEQLITLKKAGIDVDVDKLEAHVLAGGNLYHVGEALISANKAGLNYSFERIAAIDLAGRDVVDAVTTTVSPKVLVCPPPGAGAIMGVAKDGVRLSAKVRVTVRTNFDRLVGGATEQTVIARVGEGIVAAVGSAASHKEILAQPELISKYILSKGLDRGTSFEMLSVDVSDIEVIDNVGAHLQEIQAETDTQVAQAKAETRRVAAIAREREMRARIIDMTSQLTYARVVIPRAVASGYKRGNIWRQTKPVSAGFARRLWDCSDV